MNKKIISFIRWYTKDFMQKKWAHIKKQNEPKKTTPPLPRPALPQPLLPQPQSDKSNVIQHSGGSDTPQFESKPKPKAKAKGKEETKPKETPEPAVQFSQVGESVCVSIDGDENYIIDGDQPEALITWLNGLKAKFGAKAFATKFYQWNLN